MKKLLTFLMMSLMTIGIAWATEITYNTNTSLGDWEDIVAGKNGTTLKQHRLTTSEGFVLLHTNKNVTGNNTAVGTLNASELRLNSTDDFIISHSSYTITKIVYNYSQVGTQVLSTDVGDYSEDKSSGIWNGSASSVSLVGGGSGTQYRITSVTITYDGGSPKCAKPTFSLEEGTYVEAQYVTLSCATEGADIFWGYDGVNFVTYDGDPILVNKTMTLYAYAMKGGMSDSDVASATYTIKSIPTVSLPYEENFSENLDDFYVVDKVNPGFAVWNSASYNNKPFAKASGYNGGSKASESWLISPYINLTAATEPQLSFSQAINNFFGTLSDEATLWVKEKSASDWTQINITYPDAPTNGYTDFEAQTIDLSAYKGKIIQIAFKYTSSTSNSGSWEVTDVTVQEKPLEKAYYLKGSFNSWGDGIAFEKVNDNMYALRNQEVASNMEFKILNENGEYLGGQDGNAPYDITNSWFRNLPLEKDKAQNFRIVNSGTFDFIIKIGDQGIATLFVPQTTDLYLKGSFDGWSDGAKFARNEDGSYTLTEQAIDEAATFKIYDATDTWYSSDVTAITENETTITLQDGDNISIPAGKWNFNIDIAKTTMVVSRVMTPHRVVIDENIENGTVTANPTSAIAGTEITLTVTPEEGYVLDELTVMAGETEIAVENNQFIMPDADVVVSATFKKIVINEGDYVKVTSTDDLTSGTYLIVYEEGSLAFDGGLETLDAVGNSISVTISNNKIAGGDEVDAAAFTYDTSAGSFKSASGYYIGQTTDANGLKSSQTTAYENSVSIDDEENANIVSGGAYLRYNKTSGQTRFRYFKSVTYTAQQPIALYKKAGEIVPTIATPVIEGETPFYPTTTVTITCEDEDAIIYYTLDGTDPTASSTAFTAPFTLDAETTVKAIAINGNEFSVIASKEFKKKPTVGTVTQAFAQTNNTTFVFTGSLVVTAKEGSYCYAQDETGGILIYGNQIPDYKAGDVIPANFTATRATYKGSPQLQYPTGMQDATETAEFTAETITPDQITVDPYNLYMYSVIKNATIEDDQIIAGDESVTIFNERFNVEFTPEEGKTYDVYGIPGWFNDAQFMPMKYEEVKQPVVLTGVSFGDGHNWSTWYGSENLALPENVTACVVTGIEGDVVAVEPVAYIPANTGVLLYSEATAETVSAMPYTGEVAATITSKLVGGLEPQVVTNAYLLYNNNFILAQDGTTVGAHRCYLPIPEGEETAGAPHILKIGAGGTVTAIDDLRNDDNNDVLYYDLSGRCLGKSLAGKRGIFITSDGRKVVR